MWTKERWEQELATIEDWRISMGCADAWQSNCSEAAVQVIEKYSDWSDQTVMRVAMSWHPSKALKEVMASGLFSFKWPTDPTDGTGNAYSILESRGGKLSGWDRRTAAWAGGPGARARFMLITAALVVFEGRMLQKAAGLEDKPAIWCSLYWLARFHGNLERVREDTIQRRRSGRKNMGSKARTADDNRARVKAAFNRLQKSQQGSGAAGLISEATSLSAVTVRGHLTALGLRKAEKRK